MNNIILELRQKDSNNVVSNGDYETDLASEIVIEEGDLVQLKNAWVDTIAESTLTIAKDLTLTTEHILYFTHWKADATNKLGFINASGVPVDPTTMIGKRYIPYQAIKGEPDQNVIINSVTYTIYYPQPNEPFNIIYSWTDLFGNTQNIQKSVPQMTSIDDKTVHYLNIIALPNTFTLSHSQHYIEHSYGASYIIDDNSLSSMMIYQPLIFKNQISLPAGNYSPDNLSLYISEQLSKNIGNSSSMVNSQYLKNCTNFDAGQPYPNSNVISGTIPQINDNSESLLYGIGTVFFDTDITSMMFFKKNSSVKYWVGSSQIALEYDDVSQKFNWTFLHFPMYDAVSGKDISVRYMNSSGTVIGVANNGGMYFTNLSAVDSSNNIVNFWDDILGFDLNKLCVSPSATIYGNNPDVEYFKQICRVNTYNLPIVGQNITDGYFGLDSAVIKGQTSFYAEQTVPSDGQSSTIDNTQNIIGVKNIAEILDTYSHFVLSCDLHFNSNYIGLDAYRAIQGTISKFQNYGTYTYGESDGAIQYVHRGAPVMLKSIKVRILKSDKTIDANLGDDNTIIMQIIKNNLVVKK